MPTQSPNHTTGNHSPGARKSPAGRSRRASRLAIAVLGLGVLLALGIVVALVVAWFSLGSEQQADGVTQTFAVEGVRVTLEIDAATLGPRVIDVLVRDQADQPVAVDDVQLRFTYLEKDVASTDAVAETVSVGHVRSRGSFFSLAGTWRIEARIQREGQTALQVPFDVAIAAPGEVSGPLNPFTPNDQALLVGRQLYEGNCAICHGDGGRGDGPAAVGFNPRLNDLTEHMLPGVHTDGQVFLWIKDGMPGTAMPAWNQRLSDEQIWQLVMYLRTIGAAE